MAKKHPAKPAAQQSAASNQSLGGYLADIREARKLTLREVEEATSKEVSNAYLSQLETGKIQKPSPHILHALATVYSVPYETLMEKAGYLTPTPPSTAALRGAAGRHGRLATFANENLTREEEESLLEYLAFIRSRSKKGGET